MSHVYTVVVDAVPTRQSDDVTCTPSLYGVYIFAFAKRVLPYQLDDARRSCLYIYTRFVLLDNDVAGIIKIDGASFLFLQ